jgi:hypothetical protein
MIVKTSGFVVTGLLVWIVCGAGTLFAHHSFQSTFDIDKPIQLEGRVTQVFWKNPHVTFDVAVTDSSRETVNWRIEFPSVNDVFRGGFNGRTISVGSDVRVAGYVARSGERLIGASALTIKATGQSIAIPVEQSWKTPQRGGERFFDGKSINLTGTVVSMDWVNPIPLIHIEVTIPNVSTREWLVETVSTGTLEQVGWNRSTLVPGDVIHLTGKAAMSGSRKVFALSVVVLEKNGKLLASPVTLLNSTPLK